MYSVAYLTFLKKGTRKFANYKRLIPYISLPGKTLYRQSDLLRMLEENYVDMRPKRKRGKSPT